MPAAPPSATDAGPGDAFAQGSLELLDHIVVVRHMLEPAPPTPLLLQDIMGSRGDPARARRMESLRS